MRAFFVRWRSVRQHREIELFADSVVGAATMAAVEAGGGTPIWQAGTLWRCSGCGDRTLRIEEFLEGLRRAELWLEREAEERGLAGEALSPASLAARHWIQDVTLKMFGCERDRVYLKDEDGPCTFENEAYFSRV